MSCKTENHKRFVRTKKGKIARIYEAQKSNSKRRGHEPPAYSLEELRGWLMNDWLYKLLFNNWVNCGYIKNMSPSVDRIDDYIHYRLDNIRITTWGDNFQKGCKDRISGVNNKANKEVGQYSLDNVLINIFHSASQAGRDLSIDRAGIIKCCNGTRNKAGGFKWSYTA